jgi:hypothetical protein
VRLAASLIVRDEAAHIERCLASLTPLADEIVVYDTGSADDTVALARAAGARVVRGEWRDDFAWARNQALGLCHADWVLSIDADEIVRCDKEQLDRALEGADGRVFAVALHQPSADEVGGDYGNRQRRLFRREGARWVGRVHERVTWAGQAPEFTPPELADTALTVVHLGYADPDLVRSKAERNLALGLAEVAELQQGDDAESLARALFDLGRSLVGAGRPEQALAPFDDVRSLRDVGSQLWCKATDFAARQLLVLNREEQALALAQELAQAMPQHAEYGDWLAAQALVQLGEFATANARIQRVDRVVDTAGRAYAPERLREQQLLIAELVRATEATAPDSATLAGC